MRTLHGVHLTTGRLSARQMPGKAPRAARPDPVTVKARFRGKCRGCKVAYDHGELIIVRGKGDGAYHFRCWELRSAKIDFVREGLRNAQSGQRHSTGRTDRRT